ncbi:hypothetical protein GQ55_5G008000 [Panicum hallii var. hallii]|uniref:Uncharacterized protein n=1 Tax=Panicum hallii var. hallii TaxID=1504633 RepID=A0A2T7DB92_9POAL|nr:hypothetical protein GQ55_5G008000 [Panicum hallii var. hallii]
MPTPGVRSRQKETNAEEACLRLTRAREPLTRGPKRSRGGGGGVASVITGRDEERGYPTRAPLCKLFLPSPSHIPTRKTDHNIRPRPRTPRPPQLEHASASIAAARGRWHHDRPVCVPMLRPQCRASGGHRHRLRVHRSGRSTWPRPPPSSGRHHWLQLAQHATMFV